MRLLGKQCRTQAQEDRNAGPLVWKHVLEPKSAHIPCLRRFRRGTSQSDMIDLLQTHHKILPNAPAQARRVQHVRYATKTPSRRCLKQAGWAGVLGSSYFAPALMAASGPPFVRTFGTPSPTSSPCCLSISKISPAYLVRSDRAMSSWLISTSWGTAYLATLPKAMKPCIATHRWL